MHRRMSWFYLLMLSFLFSISAPPSRLRRSVIPHTLSIRCTCCPLVLELATHFQRRIDGARSTSTQPPAALTNPSPPMTFCGVLGCRVPNFVQICSKLWPCISNKEQTDRQTQTHSVLCIHRVSGQKCHYIHMPLTLPNTDRFSKFFRRQT